MDLSSERGAGRPALQRLYDETLGLKARLQIGGSRLLARQALLCAERPEERRQCRELAAHVLALGDLERRRAPALLNAAGLLVAAAGDFADAQRLFDGAAAVAARPPDQAMARYNAYRAALELRDWPAALRSLLSAAALQPEEFAPFPLRDLQPERILGAGGTGVAFLCRRRGQEAPVVVKALSAEDLGRPAVTLFNEAAELRQLAHPTLVTPLEWGAGGRGQPYLLTDLALGASLDWSVHEDGPLSPREVASLLTQVAAALGAAHRRNLHHRDLKPSNLLLRRGGELAVRVLDFGLPLRSAELPDEARDRTLLGRSMAGSRACAAPEILDGGVRGVLPGAPADVYALGRCGCVALLGAARPSDAQWQSAPPALARLLRACLADAPKDRPTAERLLEELAALRDEPRPQPSGAAAGRPTPAGAAAPATTATAAAVASDGGAAAPASEGSLVDRVQRAKAQAAQVEALRAEAERRLAALDLAGVAEALRALLALRPDDGEAKEALAHLQAQSAEQRRRRGRPSPEEILAVLRRFQPQDDLHVAPAIPPRKLAKARAVCRLPDDEEVLGLVDCTIFGDASDVVLLTQRGLHHRNMVNDPPEPGALPYEELPGRELALDAEGGASLDLGEGQRCSLVGSSMPAPRLLALLRELQAWYID